MHPDTVSVVIPALNEAAYLPATLEAVRAAFAALPADRGVTPQILVVDNDSDDGTAEVARALGADVVHEPIRSVARARNTGARAAAGAMLLFLDADTLVPPGFAAKLIEHAGDPACIGGAFDSHQRPSRAVLRGYLAVWRVIGIALGMAQGAAQFCRRDVFDALGGYDERWHMGEDVDFFWRMKRLARARGGRAVFVHGVRVVPSPRRFDQWPLWKTLLWTNPFVAALLHRRRGAWQAWYDAPPR